MTGILPASVDFPHFGISTEALLEPVIPMMLASGSPLTVTSAASTYAPIVIVPAFDPSITGLVGTAGDSTTAAEVEGAVNTAIQHIESLFSSRVPGNLNGAFVSGVTINITFSYGSLHGTPLTSSDGTSKSLFGGPLYSYSQLSPLLGSVIPALAGGDPTGGGDILVPNAQAKVLGLFTGANLSP